MGTPRAVEKDQCRDQRVTDKDFREHVRLEQERAKLSWNMKDEESLKNKGRQKEEKNL